jgi:hypothetical protein
VRRLTHAAYERAVSELLGVKPSVFSWSAPDPKVNGFDNNADALTVTSGSFEDFADAASLIADSANVTALAPCASGASEESCASDFVRSFVERAYGRAATPSEQERLLSVFRTGREKADFARGIRLALEATLLSPYFLYRIELGSTEPAPAAGTTQLSPSETANALAFAVTGARPDAALTLRAANDAAFLSREVLSDEAKRLITTPRARQHLGRFLRSWLGVDDLRTINKIPALFPEVTPTLKSDLDLEVGLFLDWALGEGGGTFEALFGGGVSFPSASVFSVVYAGDYAFSGKAPPPPPALGAFGPTPLEPSLRRGILSLPGWLAAHSPVHRSSPVDRGLAVRSRLFCQTLPSPPPAAVAAAPGPGDAAATTRQKFEQHTANPECKVCHTLIDPIGFGLEMMDGIGRFRQTEAGLPVDSSGMLSGTDVDGPFRGPAELAQKILESRRARDCFVTQLFRYVAGRDHSPLDNCRLSPLQTFFATGQPKIADLLVEMVIQQGFSQRRYEP